MFLYIDPRTIPVKLDVELLQVGGIGAVFVLFFVLVAPHLEKKRPTVVPMDSGNMQSRTNYLIKKIQQCWDEEDLNKHLGNIRKFEHDYLEAPNCRFYVQQLINAYEKQQTNIFREQARADMMIREMIKS